MTKRTIQSFLPKGLNVNEKDYIVDKFTNYDLEKTFEASKAKKIADRLTKERLVDVTNLVKERSNSLRKCRSEKKAASSSNWLWYAGGLGLLLWVGRNRQI